jgi:hypothetical protein
MPAPLLLARRSSLNSIVYLSSSAMPVLRNRQDHTSASPPAGGYPTIDATSCFVIPSRSLWKPELTFLSDCSSFRTAASAGADDASTPGDCRNAHPFNVAAARQNMKRVIVRMVSPNDRTEPQPLAARSRLQPQHCDSNNRPTAQRSGCWLQ